MPTTTSCSVMRSHFPGVRGDGAGLEKEGRTNPPRVPSLPKAWPNTCPEGGCQGVFTVFQDTFARLWSSDEPRRVSAFTWDLHRLADWFTTCHVTTVARESTGVYGMPVWQLRAARGLAVALVNARHVKHVPGRPKTDRFDCRGLQKLPTDGLLAPSFRPPEDMGRLRSFLRHREHLIPMTVQPMQPMQQSLDQMPLHLPHVMSAGTGVTGRRMLRAMGTGERAPPP